MSPWDETRYFQPSIVTIQSIPLNGTAVVLQPNVLRTGIVWGVADGETVTSLSVRPIINDPTVTGGFSLAAGQFVEILVKNGWHNVVQSGWVCTNSSGTPARVFCLEQIMRDWPPEKPGYDSQINVLINRLSRLIDLLSEREFAQ